MDDYDSKANVAEFSVGIYPPVCVSNGDGIYKPSDEFYNVKHIVIGVITNDDLNAVKDANYLPLDDTQHQVEPTEGNESNGAVRSIRSQVQSFIIDAAEAYRKLKYEVDIANDMLHRMNKPNQKIDEGLLSELEDFLTDTPAWCLSVMDEKDRTVEVFEREILDLREQQSQLLLEREELRSKLEEGSSKTSGMSAGDQRKLKALGINNLSDLINRYRKLQGELEASKKRIILEPSLTRGESLSSVCSKPEWRQQHQQEVLKQGGLTSFVDCGDISGVNSRACIPLPMPDKFQGKTRVELERYFRYFDEAVTSRGYDDKAKATIVGNYMPKLQFVHDKLIRKNITYDEIKAGLLNALGTDSPVATFTLRTSLDRIAKTNDKLYKNLLEEIEQQVSRAFNDDNDQGDAELKKILIRLTQEDSNPIFGSTIIPHFKEDYTRLKELVLGVEESLLIKKKNDSVFKPETKSPSSYGSRKPAYQQQRYPQRASAYKDSRNFGNQPSSICSSYFFSKQYSTSPICLLEMQ
uniref:Uncharacterized protein n=1 Tax=Panagrolaimus superbus TaxID=310955 RepID=A0A914Z6F2_9BILA